MELVQWIGNPNSAGVGRDIERPTQSSCRLCEIFIQRLQSATYSGSSTAEILSRIRVGIPLSSMHGEEHLHCMLYLHTRSTWPLAFAVWAHEGMKTTMFATFFVFNRKTRNSSLRKVRHTSADPWPGHGRGAQPCQGLADRVRVVSRNLCLEKPGKATYSHAPYN
jgi:hypothetical protein